MLYWSSSLSISSTSSLLWSCLCSVLVLHLKHFRFTPSWTVEKVKDAVVLSRELGVRSGPPGTHGAGCPHIHHQVRSKQLQLMVTLCSDCRSCWCTLNPSTFRIQQVLFDKCNMVQWNSFFLSMHSHINIKVQKYNK